MKTTAMIEAQHAAEALHAAEGFLRYTNDQDRKVELGGFDKRDEVQKIIRGAMPILSAALLTWINEASKPKRGRPSSALGPLQALTVGKEETPDTDKVALIALSRTFNAMPKRQPLSATAIGIGRTLQAEIEARAIIETDPKAAAKYAKLIESGASEKRAAKRHEEILEQLQIGLQWSQRTQLLVGGVVLNVLLESLEGVFERGVLKDAKGELPIIKLTAAAQETLTGMADAVAWASPRLKPMLVPPRKWERLDTGAYLKLELSRTVPMVRTYSREHQKLVREAIKSGAMLPVLTALNGIQETRFAIDKRVLAVEKWAKEQGLQPDKSFPLSEVPAVPPKLSKEEWEALVPEARVAKTRERATKRNIREAASVNAGVFKADIAEAERLADMEAFFLPHSMDSRGRVYAVPHFNPQRSDHIKALFRFADAFPMGEHGGKWLSIHLANCGDFNKMSKKPFASRLAWVERHSARLIKYAQDPQRWYRAWSKADSPFCFLQACFEYAEFHASGFSPDFLGTISVALDGSCSGLQHYSAMNRAEDEGYHVNLLPRPDVGDIYQTVCDAARPGLEVLKTEDWINGKLDGLEKDEKLTAAEKGKRAKSLLLDHLAASTILANDFGRNTLKRNTMTYFYGSGVFGMRDQHMADLMRPLADDVALGKKPQHPYALMTERTSKDTGETTEALDGGFTCAALLAKAAHQAIVTVAPKADQAASWFQGAAAILAHESLPVIWTTPMGLPVVQRYSEYTSKVVNLWLYDRKVRVPEATSTDKVEGEKVLTRIQTLIREAPTKRIDKKKARSAIAPNVVHSLDAAHLQRAVTKGLEEGIAHYQLIHDSFATHAGNTEAFFRIIREAFVEQYETYCPFEALESYARTVLSDEGLEKLEALEKPERGNLDLRTVLKAEYAFA